MRESKQHQRYRANNKGSLAISTTVDVDGADVKLNHIVNVFQQTNQAGNSTENTAIEMQR
jgi:hypothetical protein